MNELVGELTRMRALVVEDDPVDAARCIALLKKLGTAEIETVPTVAAALCILTM